MGHPNDAALAEAMCATYRADPGGFLRAALGFPETSAVETLQAQLDAARDRAEQQRAFIEKWSPTHDLDYCKIHGPWKLGPKMGGLFVATCPGCCTDAGPEAGR